MWLKEKCEEIAKITDIMQKIINDRLDLLKETIPKKYWTTEISWNGVIGISQGEAPNYWIELFHRWRKKKHLKTVWYEHSFSYFSGEAKGRDLSGEIKYELREFGHGRTDPLSGGGYKILKEEIINIIKKVDKK